MDELEHLKTQLAGYQYLSENGEEDGEAEELLKEQVWGMRWLPVWHR